MTRLFAWVSGALSPEIGPVAVRSEQLRQEGGAGRAGRRRVVRFDIGPAFVTIVVAEWCAEAVVAAVFIDPGSPWHNAWVDPLTR